MKKYLLLVVSVLGGIAGIVLRLWQLNTAFEPVTGLPISGTPATLAITLLSGLVAVLLFLLSLSLRKRNPDSLDYIQTFHFPSFLYFLFVSSAAMLTVIAAVLYYRDTLLQQQSNFLQILFSVLTLIAAVCLFLIGKNHFQGNTLKGSLLLLLPAYSTCLWLMVSYQRWARDPFVMDYVFALFAIMAGMLAHYFIASYSFSKPSLFPILISAMLAVYFSMIALADGAILAEKCLFIAQIFYFIPTAFLLCRNRAAGQSGIHHNDSDHPLKEETP